MKKNCIKLSPEQMFNIYQECASVGSPVKEILQRHGLVPWQLAEIRKKIRNAALEALTNGGHQGRKKSVVTTEQYQSVVKELTETKEALSAVGYEFALLKKKVN